MKHLITAGLLFSSFAATLHAELPKAFVEYVESTDGATYVDTGVTVNPKQTRIRATLKMNSVTDGDVAVFGRGNSWGNANSAFVLMQSGKFRFDYLGNQVNKVACTADTLYTFDFCNNEGTLNGTRYYTTVAKTDADSGQSAFLFSFNNNGSPHGVAKMKLYSAAIWKDGTTLSGRYIPCIDAEDNAGVYDLVSGNILTKYNKSGQTPALTASTTTSSDYTVEDSTVKTKLTIAVKGTGGSTTEQSRWVAVNGALTLTASPDEGMKAMWSFTDADGNVTELVGSSVTYTMGIVPVAAEVKFMYADAVSTAEELYTALENAQAGATIHLAPAQFVLTKSLVIEKGVTLSGSGEDATTIIAPTKAEYLAVNLNHADAILEKVAVTGIYFTSKPTGTDYETYTTQGMSWYPLAVKVQQGTLRDVTIRDNYATLQYGRGPWLWVAGGQVQRVKVVDNYYNRTGNLVEGYAVYMEGEGVMTDCEIARNGCPGECNGAVYMKGNAKVVGGSVHDNDGQYGSYYGGVYVSGSGNVVEKCRIYKNNNGLFLSNGTVKNCLIYGNASKQDFFSGVKMSSGKLLNCTITGNVTPSDARGISGIQMTGGTAENNIIWGNGPSTSLAGSLEVTGGTFNNNLTDKDAGRGTSNVMGNPSFADAANGDYALKLGSAACDIGKTQTLVTDDFIGTARGSTPDAGAYEYISGTTLACGIKIGTSSFLSGTSATVNAVVEGASGSETYAWYVDGTLTDQTTATPSFAGLGDGRHTVKLVVTDGGNTVEQAMTDAFTMKPSTVYVSLTGSETFPYATEETAAKSINDALTAVYADATHIGRVIVAAGDYDAPDTLNVTMPVEIVGAGRDETVVSVGKLCKDYTTGKRSAFIASEKAVLRGFTLTGATNQMHGCGVYMTAGTLDNMRVSWSHQHGSGDNYNHGAGILMEGGTVTNSLVDHNFITANYHGTSGIGIYMTAGLVVDTEIAYNTINRTQHNGLGVWAKGGIIRGCRIHDNEAPGSGNNSRSDTSGAGNVSSGHGANLSGTAIMENTLVYSNGICGVMMTGSCIVRNCAIFGHRKGIFDWFAGVNLAGGTLLNCTITDNYSSGESSGKSGLWMTGGTAINNIIYGNGKDSTSYKSCNVTGGTFKTNIVDCTTTVGSNNINSDPSFVEKTTDFHLSNGSPAIDKAAYVGLDVDIEGTARPQKDGYDIGCYEYVPSADVSVSIAVTQSDVALGRALTAAAAYENLDPSKATFTWTLEDGEGEQLEQVSGFGTNYASYVYTPATVGGFKLYLSVEYDKKVYAAQSPASYVIKPHVVYVSTTGSSTEPYDTPDKATDDLNAALSAVWQSVDATATVHVAAGDYNLSDAVSLTLPIKVLGEGRDATVFYCGGIDASKRPITLNHADVLVRGMTFTGATNSLVGVGSCARLEAGTLNNVHITKVFRRYLNDSTPTTAVGLYISGGVATNVLVDHCATDSNYGQTLGLGVYMTGGLLVDSAVISNSIKRGECKGVGVYMSNGTLLRTKIIDNNCTSADNAMSSGLGMYQQYAEKTTPIVDSCELRGNASGVYLNCGELRNSLVVGGHRTDGRVAGVRQEGGKVVNCTFADNVSTNDTTMFDYSLIKLLGYQDVPYANPGVIQNSIAVNATVTSGTTTNCLFNTDPKFRNAGRGDYRLKSGSSAINAGDNALWTWSDLETATDLMGQPRLKKSVIDLGCYEAYELGFQMIIR